MEKTKEMLNHRNLPSNSETAERAKESVSNKDQKHESDGSNSPSRHPCFQTTQKSECKIGEGPTQNSRFVLIAPGIWGLRNKGSGESSRVNRSHHHARKRSRVRRQPDFLRIEWRKSGRSSKKVTERKKRQTNSSMITSLGHDLTEFDSSSSSLASFHDQDKYCHEESRQNQDLTNKEDHSDLKFDDWAKMLHNFDKGILEQVIDKITEANERCFKQLLQKSHSAEKEDDSARNCSLFTEGFERSDQKLLQETIDKLISQYEKCLQTLGQSVSEPQQGPSKQFEQKHFEPSKTVKIEPNESTSENIIASSSSTFDIPTSRVNCNITEEKPSTSDATREESESSEVSTIDINKIRNRHIRRGKRVIPRLKSESSRSNAEEKKVGDSVEDVFAEYARKNSELGDFIALIDPSLKTHENASMAATSINMPPAVRKCNVSDVNKATESVSIKTNKKKTIIRSTITENSERLQPNDSSRPRKRVVSEKKAHPFSCQKGPAIVSVASVIARKPEKRSISDNKPDEHVGLRPNKVTCRSAVRPQLQAHHTVRYVGTSNPKCINMFPYQRTCRPTVSRGSADLTNKSTVYIPKGFPRFKLANSQVIQNTHNARYYRAPTGSSTPQGASRRPMNNVRFKTTMMRIAGRK